MTNIDESSCVEVERPPARRTVQQNYFVLLIDIDFFLLQLDEFKPFFASSPSSPSSLSEGFEKLLLSAERGAKVFHVNSFVASCCANLRTMMVQFVFHFRRTQNVDILISHQGSEKLFSTRCAKCGSKDELPLPPQSLPRLRSPSTYCCSSKQFIIFWCLSTFCASPT